MEPHSKSRLSFWRRPPWRQLRKVIFFELDGDQNEVADAVIPVIEIRGTRFWFLLSSCVIGAIGLNTNSAAVIIGAMLVSPLMGPLLGLGFGLAVGSRDISWQATKNLVWATAISLLVSTVYFLVSPFKEITPEILARTAPTLLDLFVAIAAAFAGVIALTTRGTTFIVPGVAIATAIIPPLCSAGFGLAQWDLKIALGAFYLFAINALAISMIAFLLFKRMHFHEFQEDIDKHRTLPRAAVIAVLVVFVAPLGWTLRSLWKGSQVQKAVRELVSEYRDPFEIVNWHFDGKNKPRLTVYAFKPISPEDKGKLAARLDKIAPGATLFLRHTSDAEETQELITKLKASPIYPALSDSTLLTKLMTVSSETKVSREDAALWNGMERELAAILGDQVKPYFFSRKDDTATEIVVLLEVTKNVSSATRKSVEKRIGDWLKVRRGSKVPFRVFWTDARG